MKTKNIFRMLLVAAALLMGANNVKADNETVWSSGSGHDLGAWEGNKALNLSAGTFNPLKCDGKDIIRVYGRLGSQQTIQDEGKEIRYGIELRLNWDSNGAKIKYTNIDYFTEGYHDFEITDQSFAQALKNNAIINGYNFIVTSIVINPTSISFNPNVVNFVFGGTYEAPAVTKTPANANVTYSSSNTNVAAIDGNGNVVPVGAGSATITGTLANTNVSATYTLNVTAPTRTGAIWNGAAWLGNYTQNGVGTQPQIPTTNLKSAQVGDNIRFYGKLGPLSATDWRCEVHGNPWSNQLGDPSGNDAFANGYFDLPITTENIGMLNTNNLILNGYNLTITAVELIPASAPVKQDVTLAFSASTATATIGEAFDEPTLTATANGLPVTGLNISYSSSNVSVATVDNYGNVDLISPGTATITASFAGNSNYNPATASYTLSVEAAIPDGELVTVEMYNYNLRTYVTPFVIDFSRSVGVEGYYAKEVSGNDVVLYQVTGKCAANVPLLLRMTGTNAQVWKVSDTNATGITPTPNLLEPGPITAEGNNVYVLTYHNNNYVFAETEYVSAVVDATHAYLNLNNVSTARGRLNIKLVGESTGIISLQSDEQSFDGAIYNLRGQRVERPTKGLYIINGKKVLIK